MASLGLKRDGSVDSRLRITRGFPNGFDIHEDRTMLRNVSPYINATYRSVVGAMSLVSSRYRRIAGAKNTEETQ